MTRSHCFQIEGATAVISTHISISGVNDATPAQTIILGGRGIMDTGAEVSEKEGPCHVQGRVHIGQTCP